MSILVISVITLTFALLLIGKDKGWGYLPVSLCSLLFVVPFAMLVFGFL